MPVRAAADDFGDASKARAGARAREPPLRLGSSFVRRAGASLRHGGGGTRALPGRGGADKVSRQMPRAGGRGPEARARAARRSFISVGDFRDAGPG